MGEDLFEVARRQFSGSGAKSQHAAGGALQRREGVPVVSSDKHGDVQAGTNSQRAAHERKANLPS